MSATLPLNARLLHALGLPADSAKLVAERIEDLDKDRQQTGTRAYNAERALQAAEQRLGELQQLVNDVACLMYVSSQRGEHTVHETAMSDGLRKRISALYSR